MESSRVAWVTPPDLCLSSWAFVQCPRLQAGALLIESGLAGGACNGAHYAPEFTYIGGRKGKLNLSWGSTLLGSPRGV